MEKIIVESACPLCGKHSFMALSEEEYDRYIVYKSKNGFVQKSFPEFDVFEREFLNTGHCIECQKSIFGTEYPTTSHRWVADEE